MKVVVDDKIPFIREALEQVAEHVIYLPGAEITADDVRDADALIVRTRTHCNRELLEGSKVSFIGTATIGYDHLDIDFLKEAGITWTNCPGCNATSVGQYINSCLLLLAREKGISLSSITMGIVGVGHVGQAVHEAVKTIGVTCLLNDPPRQQREGVDFVSLQELAEKCDIISFHTPLVRDGAFPTFHLADESFFARLLHKPILINSGRGEVVDNQALLNALDKGQISEAIIDTWEHEPQINLELLNRVYIGTPHIAGYSADGKANATRMVLEAFCQFFNLEKQFTITAPDLPPDFIASTDCNELALQLYNPHQDSQLLKQNPDLFEYYRGHYPLRRETI